MKLEKLKINLLSIMIGTNDTILRVTEFKSSELRIKSEKTDDFNYRRFNSVKQRKSRQFAIYLAKCKYKVLSFERWYPIGTEKQKKWRI